MLPVLTSPRGSRNESFESLDSALKDLNASARDSDMDFPKVETVPCTPLLAADKEAVAAGLKRPAHAFGLAQALGGGEMALASSAWVSSTAGICVLVSVCPTSAVGIWGCGSSWAFSDGGLEEFRATAFGKAGMMGTAGKANLVGFGATGVVSPAAGKEGCCVDDGVVGFVESAASEAGWLVEGVSGRGIEGSTGAGSVS